MKSLLEPLVAAVPPPTEERIRPGNWFSIGIFSGPSPLELSPAPGVQNPVLTYQEIHEVPAIFVADPFLIRRDAQWYMFFEVMNEETYRGEIAWALSHDGISWEYRGLVLVEPVSLSYPQVFEWQGEIYMLPEMYQKKGLRLYRGEPFPTHWNPVTDLLAAKPVTDASIFRFEGRWWILACSDPDRNETLRLYVAEHLEGPWHEHPQSPVVEGDPFGARPAGRVVQWNGRWIRFAQECFPKYGGGVRAFEITRLTPHEYMEKPADRPPLGPLPREGWNSLAMHHVDAHCLEDGSWLAVVDGHDHPSYRH